MFLANFYVMLWCFGIIRVIRFICFERICTALSATRCRRLEREINFGNNELEAQAGLLFGTLSFPLCVTQSSNAVGSDF